MLINSFSIQGYRSFGDTAACFSRLSKINLIIGQNNSGKSNVLRFLRDIYPRDGNWTSSNFNATDLDKHIGSNHMLRGVAVRIPLTVGDPPPSWRPVGDKANWPHHWRHQVWPKLRSFVQGIPSSSELRGPPRKPQAEFVWLQFHADKRRLKGVWLEPWKEEFARLGRDSVIRLWQAMHPNTSGGSMEGWIVSILDGLVPVESPVEIVLVPSVREVTADPTPDDQQYGGAGLINKLARLQNPSALDRADTNKFQSINQFLQSVTNEPTATIEIPHSRDTILVHMNGRTLPLDSVGTGIHEVVILASTSTVLDKTVVCIEEPELHLNPLLQKKLIRYLEEETSNQYFITTHSAALMDTPCAEIYHVQLIENASTVTRVTSDEERVNVCSDLGYRPSDLIQSNCVIWVEGPSDRIYIKYWLDSAYPDRFFEGIHYSIMFYGGRLLSHLHGEQIDNSIGDKLISLRRLNQHCGIVIDSDRQKKGDRINATKKRLSDEFGKDGFVWLTEGREIENYVSLDLLTNAIKQVHPESTVTGPVDKYGDALSFVLKNGKVGKPDKVEIARAAASADGPVLDVLDLHKKINEMAKFIAGANGEPL